MRRLLRLAFQTGARRWLLSLSIAAMLLLTVASQLEIFTLGVITKKGQWNQSDFIQKGISLFDSAFNLSENVFNLALMVVLVAIFKALTLFTYRFSTRLIAIRVSSDLRQDYFEHIQSLPMSFYQEHHSAGLSTRVVGDAALIAEAINASLINYLQTPFTIITTLCLCFATSWQLSLIIFFGCPLIIFPIVFLARRIKRISKQLQKNQEHFAAVLLDFLSGIQTVKVFAMEEFSLKKYREQNARMAALEKKSARYDLSSRPVLHTIGMMFLATALLYGLYVLQMSVAEVLFYCGMLYLFYEPIKKFAEENSRIQRGVSAAERMFEVLDLQPLIEDRQDAQPFADFQKEIEFDRVSFRYGDEWVLKDFSCKIRKGESVALVGPTGAGKSTVAQLLPRLYEVQEGAIRIDGQPIQTYTQKSLREAIAYVPQRPFLFADTISANISFGRPFSDHAIQAAAKQAHAEEFIVQLPQAYQTLLAEGGKNFSGGQQQRLAIARALVKNAPILVMDEATSALDAVSEQQIKNALEQQHGKVTQIIIAHRLSTIQFVDRVIYIEKGRKIAEGTQKELLQSCPGFKKMWETMMAGQGP